MTRKRLTEITETPPTRGPTVSDSTYLCRTLEYRNQHFVIVGVALPIPARHQREAASTFVQMSDRQDPWHPTGVRVDLVEHDVMVDDWDYFGDDLELLVWGSHGG